MGVCVAAPPSFLPFPVPICETATGSTLVPRVAKAFSSLQRFVRRHWHWLTVVLLLAVIELSYVFIITAGTFSNWPTWNANYDLQAEGFRAGHLYLVMQPSPELIAKPNPYDWSNVSLWFWDASYYKGHYYLYWGPFPAVVLAVVKSVFRIKSEVGDQYLLFAFYTIYLVAGGLLIVRAAQRSFTKLPRSLVLLSVGVLAYANPTPYMIATPGIYEAAIAGDQAFLLLGMWLAFEALTRTEARPSPRLLLALAGTAWAIAIACRVSAGPPAALLCLLTALCMPRGDSRPWHRRVIDLAYTAVPVGVGSFALLAYNKARFDAWFEFGLGYQLNTMPLAMSRTYLPLNLYSYLLRPLGVSCQFPFVFALRDIGTRGFWRGVKLPPEYMTHEPLAGMLMATPWSWLVIAALGLGVFAMVRAQRVGAPIFAAEPARRARVWLAVSAVVLATTPILPVIAGIGATMRYLADISTGFILAATWGAWSLVEHLGDRPWPRRAALGTLAAVAGVTIALGMLLGFQGYDDTFKHHNPGMYQALTRRLSTCGS